MKTYNDFMAEGFSFGAFLTPLKKMANDTVALGDMILRKREHEKTLSKIATDISRNQNISGVIDKKEAVLDAKRAVVEAELSDLMSSKNATEGSIVSLDGEISKLQTAIQRRGLDADELAKLGFPEGVGNVKEMSLEQAEKITGVSIDASLFERLSDLLAPAGKQVEKFWDNHWGKITIGGAFALFAILDQVAAEHRNRNAK